MITTTHPTKEQVREYFKSRTTATTPPPSIEQIRRELGWEIIPNHTPQSPFSRG